MTDQLTDFRDHQAQTSEQLKESVQANFSRLGSELRETNKELSGKVQGSFEAGELLLRCAPNKLHGVAEQMVRLGGAVHESIDLSRDTIPELVGRRHLIAPGFGDVVI